ncbi:hypothetical protein B0H16DRAFT_1626625 [Mycena metata]|uniref:F-box domain-containing protein n=1 Tax=Mycena metata TaxID=1033252 RepID=A0AAD7H4T5_9AGAR|nr:hypothetical protein B0H16DRAFT_1626625 [Mycena metata]
MRLGGLPPELFHSITKDIDEDDPTTIFTLRLVSKSVNSVVSPLAFRVLVVNDSVRSAAGLSLLQGCDESVKSLVHEVIFRGDPQGTDPEWRNETSGAEGRNALKAAFAGLANFPNLKKLRLDFHSCYQEEPETTEDGIELATSPSHFLLLQQDIFAGLAATSLSLDSLTLNHLLAFPSDLYLQEDFYPIFRPLQVLDVSVLSDGNYDGAWYAFEPINGFWEQSMAQILRSAASLTALTIRSDQPVGSCPALSADSFHPKLTSLSLHNFSLDPHSPERDAVDFILRHKSTLAHLELHGCSIDGGEGGDFPRPWHVVLTLFAAELGCLRTFVFENEEEEEEPLVFERDPRFRYTKLDVGWGYTSWEGQVNGAHQDLPALESLMAVVKSRHGD